MSKISANFRLARDDEDELVARVLYNAFVNSWDINWWQNMSSPIRPIAPYPLPSDADLTSDEKARMRFYRGVVRFTRRLGGVVCVAEPDGTKAPAAVLLWFPPKVDVTVWALIWSGFIWSVLRFGLVGAFRLAEFEHWLDGLYARSLRPLGYSSRSEGAFVQIVGTDPTHKGKALSENLLRWQIQRHKKAYPGLPVFLDTANKFAEPIYERIGFRTLGKHQLAVNRNSVMEQHRDTDFFQAVMMLEPENM